jgi:hypothetical protein
MYTTRMKTYDPGQFGGNDINVTCFNTFCSFNNLRSNCAQLFPVPTGAYQHPNVVTKFQPFS